MTEKANPSPSRPADAFATAGAIAYGGSIDGFIIDGASPTAISQQDAEINEDNLDTFSQSSSSSSLTISISGGEGFVFGAWLAIDTQTTITLDASTSGQTVFLGWNKNSSNDVIIGLDDAFSTVPTDTDQRIPLYEFDTDASGVTAVRDERQVGKAETLTKLSVAESFGVPIYSDSTNAPSEMGSTILIDGSSGETFGLYSYNGSAYQKVGNSDEEIESLVASIVAGGNAIDVSYNDLQDSVVINNTGAYFDEDARDAIGDALVGGTKIDVTYDEPNNEIDIDTSALDEEEVQDAVNSLLVGDQNITFTYDDAGDTLSVQLSNSIELSNISASSSITDPAGVEHTGELADDGDTQPPQLHGSEAHDEDFAIDGSPQPPEDHGNNSHIEDYATPEDVNSSNWGDYEIQKDGTDGNNIINFKTN